MLRKALHQVRANYMMGSERADMDLTSLLSFPVELEERNECITVPLFGSIHQKGVVLSPCH